MIASAFGATTSLGASQKSQRRDASPASRPRRCSHWGQRKWTDGTRVLFFLRALQIPVFARVDDDLFPFAHEWRHEDGHAILEFGRLVGCRSCRALHLRLGFGDAHAP